MVTNLHDRLKKKNWVTAPCHQAPARTCGISSINNVESHSEESTHHNAELPSSPINLSLHIARTLESSHRIPTSLKPHLISGRGRQPAGSRSVGEWAAGLTLVVFLQFLLLRSSECKCFYPYYPAAPWTTAAWRWLSFSQ